MAMRRTLIHEIFPNHSAWRFMHLCVLLLMVFAISTGSAQSANDTEAAFIDLVFKALELEERECPPGSDKSYRCAVGTTAKQDVAHFEALLLEIENDVSGEYARFAVEKVDKTYDGATLLGNIEFRSGAGVRFLHQGSTVGGALVILAPAF